MSRTLIAGIGNIFFGDDAFGVEVVRRLRSRPLPPEVDVVDFGIRGFDLACALSGGKYEQVILVDALARGGSPGTLRLLEPDVSDLESAPAGEPHGLAPVQAIRLAMQLARQEGKGLPPLRLLGCEPLAMGSYADPRMGLSPPVEEAVGEAVRMIESLVGAAVPAGADGAGI
jgi:hydrogenase maturation protease